MNHSPNLSEMIGRLSRSQATGARASRITILSALSILALCSVPAVYADCGSPPPTNTSLSSNYYKAQAYFYHSYFHNSSDGHFNVTIPAEGVPIPIGAGASSDSTTEQTGWQSLTQAEASNYVQQEYSNHAAAIVAECGYRMCNLLGANAPASLRLAALSFQQVVCSGWQTPDGTSGAAGPQDTGRFLSASPSVMALEFQQGSTPVVRTIQVGNHSPDLATVRALVSVDYGGSTVGNGTVILLKKNGKPLPAGLPLKVTIKPGQSVPVSFSVSAPVQDLAPRLVVTQLNNAPNSTSTQLSLASAAAPVVATTGLSVTGQTVFYAPNDDGQLQVGSPTNFVDNGDGTVTDNNTGLTWEKKSFGAGGLHGDDNYYSWASAFLWIQNVNQEGGTGFAGHNDWRIPNIRELYSIVSYAAHDPSVSPAFNSNCVSGCTVGTCSCTGYAIPYWSSTTFLNNPSSAFKIGFSLGDVDITAKSDANRVRAVRGGR